MKLFDGGVLLIISAAVIGPIEPQAKETVAETCERAMVEVGAYVSTIDAASKRKSWEIAYLGRDGKTEVIPVICIPAPSGLMR